MPDPIVYTYNSRQNTGAYDVAKTIAVDRFGASATQAQIKNILSEMIKLTNEQIGKGIINRTIPIDLTKTGRHDGQWVTKTDAKGSDIDEIKDGDQFVLPEYAKSTFQPKFQIKAMPRDYFASFDQNVGAGKIKQDIDVKTQIAKPPELKAASHKVKAGETIEDIARIYHKTPQEIILLNPQFDLDKYDNGKREKFLVPQDWKNLDSQAFNEKLQTPGLQRDVDYLFEGETIHLVGEPTVVAAQKESRCVEILRREWGNLNRATFQGGWHLLPMKDPAAGTLLGKYINPISPGCGAFIYASNQAVIGLMDKDPDFAKGKAAEVALGAGLMWNNFIHAVGSGNPTLASKLLNMVGKPECYQELTALVQKAAAGLQRSNPNVFQQIQGLLLTTVGATGDEKLLANFKVAEKGFLAATLLHGAGFIKKAWAYSQAPEGVAKDEMLTNMKEFAWKAFPKDLAFGGISYAAGKMVKEGIAESSVLLKKAADLRAQASLATDPLKAKGLLKYAQLTEQQAGKVLGAAKSDAGKLFGKGFALVDAGCAGHAWQKAQTAQGQMQYLMQTPANQRDAKWQADYKNQSITYRENMNNCAASTVNAAANLSTAAVLPLLAINVVASMSCPSRDELIAKFKERGLDYESADNPWLGIEKSPIPANFAVGALASISGEAITDQAGDDNKAWEYTKALVATYNSHLHITDMLSDAASSYGEFIQRERAAGVPVGPKF